MFHHQVTPSANCNCSLGEFCSTCAISVMCTKHMKQHIVYRISNSYPPVTAKTFMPFKQLVKGGSCFSSVANFNNKYCPLQGLRTDEHKCLGTCLSSRCVNAIDMVRLKQYALKI